MKITILRGKKNLFCSNLTKYLTFQGSSLQDGLGHKRKFVLQTSRIGIAIGYTTNLWSSLQSYLYDGNLQIDNNLIENKIRPIALGRKN